MIHVATLHLSEPSPEGETKLVLASVDGGEHYLPVTRYPEVGEEEAIAKLFEGDGNFKPMTFGRRALNPAWWRGGTVTKIEHSEVGA